MLFFVMSTKTEAYNQAYYQTGYYGQSGYYSQSYYYAQGSYGTVLTGGVTITGNLSVTGNVTKGSGTFVIDHPLDPKNKLLYHSFVESPDVKNIYDGVATLDEFGEAQIQLPSYFEALNKDFRYQVKPINTPSPNLYIKEEVSDNRFTIAGGEPHARVSWQVTGIRHDPYILEYPIEVEVEKGPNQLVDKGEYIHPPSGFIPFLSSLFSNIKYGIALLFGLIIDGIKSIF